jgi:hypothetical protein
VSIDTCVKGALRQVQGVFRNLAGDLIDPTTVKLEVSKRSGVTTYTYPVNIVRDSLGTYHVDVSADESGTILYVWKSTGTGQAVQYGQFAVEAR